MNNTIEYFRIESDGTLLILRMVSPELTDSRIIRGFRDAILETLRRVQPKQLLLEFSTVRHASSETINTLIKAYEWCAASGARMKLCGVNVVLDEMLAICKLKNRLFFLYESEQAALEAFARE